MYRRARRLLLLALFAACAKRTPAPRPAAASNPALTIASALARAQSCVQALAAVSQLQPGIDASGKMAMLSALGACERVLVPTLSPAERAELKQGRALYALAFSGVSDDELAAYAGLLHRFVLATDIRGVLHFGPLLARLFILRNSDAKRACDLPQREAAFFFALTPTAFGGDGAKASAYVDRALAADKPCAADVFVVADIARIRLDVIAAQTLLSRVEASGQNDLATATRARVHSILH